MADKKSNSETNPTDSISSRFPDAPKPAQIQFYKRYIQNAWYGSTSTIFQIKEPVAPSDSWEVKKLSA